MLKIIFLLTYLITSSALAKTFLVKAGHILDLESGKWIRDQTLLIENGKIVEVNPKRTSAKLFELDLSKYYLIPGLIDAHTHLFLEDATLGKDFAKGLFDFYQKTSDDQRYDLASRRSHSLIRSGFTAVRDLGNSGAIVRSQLKKSDLKFYSSGPGHVPKLGQFPTGTAESILFKEYARLDKASYQSLVRGSRTTLKLYADEDPNPNLTEASLLKQWTRKGKKLGMKVAIHAILQPAIEASIEAGADSIEHGTYATADQFKRMAQKKISWVPSLGPRVLTFEKFKNHAPVHIFNELKLLCSKIPIAHKLGVRVVFGSDYYYSLEKMGMSFGEATLEALLFLNQCGLSNLEVIRSATLYPAELLGSTEVGQLRKGSWADFVALKDDPLTNLSTLRSPLGVYLLGQKRD